MLEKAINSISSALHFFSPKMRISGLVTVIIRKFILIYNHRVSKKTDEYDGFYIQYLRLDNCIEPLHLEFDGLLHEILPNGVGVQNKFIPKEKFKIYGKNSIRVKISNFSEHNINVKFFHADIVKFDNFNINAYNDFEQPDTIRNKYNFIKCVVFDLDNTLWNGVIGDDGADGIIIKPEIIPLIIELDRRGILLSIASKNQFDLAFNKIIEIGLKDYFLYPQIHWGPKSGSITEIANSLNINVNSIAFIDDSEFERQEVSHVHQDLSIYDEAVLDDILNLPEFNPPITSLSKFRRKSYIEEATRVEIKNNFKSSNDQFLKECNLKMKLHHAVDHKDRCFELLARTNQYNISGIKYDRNMFENLLSKEICFCINITDKFGDYGIVAFISLYLKDGKCTVSEFVMSCRVAEKRVEETLFLILKQVKNINSKLMIKFKKTSRNSPIENKLKSIGFTGFAKNNNDLEGNVFCSIDLNENKLDYDIYTLNTEDFKIVC